ncbi:transposase [Ralstonia holmesii]|uniref:transposase n=1 Tax=Ralstonia holmesii TaxID=3058602 RepID=UPI003F6D719B
MTGRLTAFGNGCIWLYSSAYASTTRSTGAEPALTVQRWPAPGGGEQTGPNPTDRDKLGSKRHLVVDRRGVPLTLMVAGANRHDSIVFEALVDAIPSVPGLDGRPRCRHDKLHADVK